MHKNSIHDVHLFGTRICTSNEILKIDQEAFESFGIDSIQLMESAGVGCALKLIELFPSVAISTELVIIAGRGNNAGDAFVLARALHSMGRKSIRIFCLDPLSRMTAATAKNFKIIEKLQLRWLQIDSVSEFTEYCSRSVSPLVVLDGLFGTGLKGPIEGLYREVIDAVNQLREIPHSPLRAVFAIDIPSGLSATTGICYGKTVIADHTLSLAYPKVGYYLQEGPEYCGKIHFVPLPLPFLFQKRAPRLLIDENKCAPFYLKRSDFKHKHEFGHVAILGGSPGRVGAPIIAAQAAMKSGAGLSTLFSWQESLTSIIQKCPAEIMFSELSDSVLKSGVSSEYTVALWGPGLLIGKPKNEQAALLKEIHHAISYTKQVCVLDADVLTSELSQVLKLRAENHKTTIITPHFGEFARLLGISAKALSENTTEILEAFVEKYQCWVVLKNYTTIIAGPSCPTLFWSSPNSALATAGSGDILCGIIAGLLAQGMETPDSLVFSVLLHSFCGRNSTAHLSTATELLALIPHSIESLQNLSLA